MSDTIFGSKRDIPKPKDVNIYRKKEEKKRYKDRVNKPRNIQFPLLPSDKMTFMYKALEHNLKISTFTNMVVKNELKSSHNYEDFKYNKNGELVSFWLEDEYFKDVQRLSVLWGVSYRRVVHRLVKNYLARETSTHGFKIIDNRK